MFNPSDIYTQADTQNLFMCWDTPVTKFEPSSFYNWEQDNIPIIELENRTEFLWGRLGYPTSATLGFSYVVSAEANSECNYNYFSNLEECLEAIPEVINSPYLIEVASYGALGNLVLSNKIFGPSGSIEIINRNFGKSFAKASVGGSPTAINKEGLSATSFYASSIKNVSATGYPGLLLDFKQAKILSTNQLVPSSTATIDARLNGNLTVFTKNPYAIYPNILGVGLNQTPTISNYTDAELSFTRFEATANSSEKINQEIAAIGTGYFSNSNSSDQGNVSLGYGNRLDSIKIYNCNGPIYIRNFTVNGGGYGGREIGIDIRNSNVNLENCSVTRCTRSGLFALNSKVNVSRSFISYRNYGFDSAGTRLFVPLENGSDDNIISKTGAGIELVNSELEFVDDYDRELTYIVDSGNKFYTINNQLASSIGVSSIPAAGWLFCTSRNDVGIKAFNSKIYGGHNGVGRQFHSLTENELIATNLTSEVNNIVNYYLDNSVLEFNGRTTSFGGNIGFLLNNSRLSTNALLCKQTLVGMKAINSKVIYNKDSYLGSILYDNNTVALSKVAFNLNSKHLELNNSIMDTPLQTSALNKSGRVVFVSSLGDMEPIIATNSSLLHLVHPAIDSVGVSGIMPVRGGSVKATFGSEVILRGSSKYASIIKGPDNIEYQKLRSEVYAGNGSTIRVQGPTAIFNCGVPLHVEDNSTLEISPHMAGERLLSNEFSLSINSNNHTAIELHSTRSCIVANKSSTVNIRDLGYAQYYWINGAYGFAEAGKSLDYFPTTLFRSDDEASYRGKNTSGGYLQFYPNPNEITSNIAVQKINKDIYAGSFKDLSNLATNGLLFDRTLGALEFSAVTKGGMCLRATDNSTVNVENVHFPCGWWNASAIVYDSDGPEQNCCKTFIWNIADTSRLNAKYLSVSGHHPADVGYTGPLGAWFSATNAIAYGAPSTTPDTSSLSVLDYYGASGGHRFANVSATNYGPFRLYFSIDPAANWLVPLNLEESMTGYVRQVFAQGYQFSGPLYIPSSVLGEDGATVYNLSSMQKYYKSLLFASGVDSSVASGFYYASSMLANPFVIRATLDDSAANTFANAKHNSVGKSGLGKVVEIYFPYMGTDYNHYGGDSATDGNKKIGQGLLSVNTFDLERIN